MNGKEDRNVSGMRRLAVAVVVIHDLQHPITPALWPPALTANGAAHRRERPQWTDIMR